MRSQKLLANTRSLFLRLPLLYLRSILILAALGIFSSLFLLLGPYFSVLFIDQVFLRKNPENFFVFSGWGAALFLVSLLFHAATEVVKNTLRVRVKFDLARRFMRKFYALDLSFFRTQSAGESVYRVSDIEGLSNFIIDEWPSLIADVFKLLIFLGISSWLNIRLTALLVLLSPLFLLQSLYLQKKLVPVYEQLWYSSARLSQQIAEAFSNMLLIKALGLERFQRHRYLKLLIENIRLHLKHFRWTLAATLTSSFLSKAVYAAIALYGGWLILKSQTSLGTYTAVMLYIGQIGILLENAAVRFSACIKENIALQRFWEIAQSYPRIRDAGHSEDFTLRRGLVIGEASFGYRSAQPVFEKLCLEIPAASWVALAGPSGCGKTTLINLILRLYDPWEGTVSYDGKDVRSIRLDTLRRKTALAPQEPFLFDGTIRQNIVYGLRHYRQQDMETAAEISGLRDFIGSLPQGYETAIGETGCTLSQGLKQRLSLARAIIRNPDLLIMDEATSSIDSFTEEAILRMLRKHRQGLVTVVVSHRLSSVRDADRIFFFKSASELEAGTHAQLLHASQSYRAFFQAQLETLPR